MTASKTGILQHIMRKPNIYKKDSTYRQARTRKILIAALILFGLYRLATFVFGEMGWIKSTRMEAHFNELTVEVAGLKKNNDMLRNEIHALKTNPDYLEKIARDKMGLVRPGEIVYYFDPRE